jgi:type III secretion protein J
LVFLVGGCDSRTAPQELARVDSEKEANRILVELEARGIKEAAKVEKAEQRKTAWSITVPQTELSAARNVLVQCDLPRETHGGFSAMAESSSLIPTKSEERAKLINALSGELERTFETYDRVVSARVHIVLPEKDPLSRSDATTKPTASAMVLIKYTPLPTVDAGNDKTAVASAADPPLGVGSKPNYADAPVGMEEVQQMVARSIEGLTPQNVFVTYTRSAPRTILASAVPAAAASPTTMPSSVVGATVADKKLMMQLFGAVAVFGLVAILLTVMLVREKRKGRAAA